MSSQSGSGWDLIRALSLEVAKESATGAMCRCVFCPSSDALSVCGQTGRFHCFSCKEKGGPYRLATTLLGNKKNGVELLVRLGIFKDRAFSKHGSGGGSEDEQIHRDPVAEMARAKGCNSAALETYGAKASIYRSKVDGHWIREPVAEFPTYAPNGSVSCLFYCGAYAAEEQLKKGKNQSRQKAAGPPGLFLPNAQMPKAGECWVIVEGVKDAARAYEMGLLACGLPGSALPSIFASRFRGVDVILVPDRDHPGEAGAERTGRILYGVAASIRIVTLPMEWAETKGADLRDAIKAHGEQKIRELVQHAPLWEPRAGVGDARRRIIVAVDGTNCEPLDITRLSVAALRAQNTPPTLFRRGKQMVVISEDEVEALDDRRLECRIQASAAYYVDRGSKGMNPVPAPKHVVRTILGGEGLAIWPKLRGVAPSPIIRPDGTVLAGTGYDAATGIYRPANSITVEVKDEPTHADAMQAVGELFEPFEEFPFADIESQWNFFALLMSPFLRYYIDDVTPLFLVDAVEPGAGKSKIVDAVSWIFCGERSRKVPMGRDDDLNKELSSALSGGKPILNIDNIGGKLASSSLERLLTDSHWSGRLFHTNDQQLVLENLATWCATGNNLELGSEIRRRSVLIQLVEQRRTKFRFPNLQEWILANRVRLCTAALTIARAWIVAGKPCVASVDPLPSFENWTFTIGAIALWCDGSILGNQQRLAAANDVEQAEWRAFLLALAEANPFFETSGLTVTELVHTIKSFRDTIEETLPGELADHFEGRGFPHRLGRALRKRSGRRHGEDGLRVVTRSRDPHIKTPRWLIERE